MSLQTEKIKRLIAFIESCPAEFTYHISSIQGNALHVKFHLNEENKTDSVRGCGASD